MRRALLAAVTGMVLTLAMVPVPRAHLINVKTFGECPDVTALITIPVQMVEVPHTEISRGKQEKPKVLVVTATAYTWTGYKTFTETWPKEGTIAVDPAVIPLGSRLYIPDYGWGIAEDTGGDIKGNKIDVYMDSESQAKAWGRRKKVEILVY